MSKTRMQLLPFIHGSINLPHCSICPISKQIRLQFPFISTSKSSCCFALIHIDVWGPFHAPTHNGERYFLTIVDDFSKSTWVYLMHFKVDVLQLLKNFFQQVRTQFSALVKVVRANNASEFFKSECTVLFNSLGIIHQSSCPHTPQQNGVVERKHRHILDIARALRFQASLPLKFWGNVYSLRVILSIAPLVHC